MSAELVMQKDAQGNETGLARMVLRSQGWHKSAHVKEVISLDDVRQILGTDSPVEVHKLTYPDGSESAFAQGVQWEGHELGVVGPQWQPLQNEDFLRSFEPWLDGGYASIEGAGLLRGGAVIYMQLNPAALEPIEVRKDDAVRSRIFGMNTHDGSTSMRVGSCDERIVCANTLAVALKEVDRDNASGKTNGHRASHRGNVAAKMLNIQLMLVAMREALTKHVEAWKFLDSKPVKDSATCYKFSRALSGKKPDEVDVQGFKPSTVDMEIERLFRHGKGNLGRSYWDLLNAATERHTWGEGNDMAGDRSGDKEARRLDSVYFGTLANANARAFKIAYDMAKAA